VRARRAGKQAHGSTGPETVRIWLLGGFRVTVGAREVGVDLLPRRKAGRLVKLLALAPGHALHRERVTDLLWPGLDTKPANNNLHRVLHTARRAFDPSTAGVPDRYLALRDEVVRLCPDSELLVDVDEFERAATAARRSGKPAAYRSAIDLYAGDLLPEDLYEEWAMERREALRGLCVALLLELSALYESRGERQPAIEALREAISRGPAMEEANVALMRLYAACGRYGEAVLQYERFREVLRRDLDAVPGPATRSLDEQIRAGRIPVSEPPPVTPGDEAHPSPPNNLPTPLTSFVGREEALVEVRRLLSMTRLLTLSGAGGSGKTRLALEAARDLVGAYPDGVWFVELAPVSDPALVARSVASVIDVREQPGLPLARTLAAHLATRRVLLVLDNCEHVVGEAARLGEELLKSCAGLRILATSREPLGVPGETLWSVPPLSLPRSGATVDDLAGTDAVRLFMDRARSRLPGFDLTEDNAGAIARVCGKLDGIPLAIELATARVGALAVEQLASRLEDSLGLLAENRRTADPRQRTMTATLDWGYRLLEEAERSFLTRLSVFTGGMTLEAIEWLCSDFERDEVLDLVPMLVRKSLLVAQDTDGAAARYRMLEPIRQHAWERLQARGEADRARERHANYYLTLALEMEPRLYSPDPGPWLATLGREIGNLRAALSWALDEDARVARVETGLRLGNALARFWDAQGPGEGRRWLEKGLARNVEVPPSVRAEALIEAGFVAVYEWDPRSVQMLAEALALYRDLGDKPGILAAVDNLGHALAHHADPQTAAPIKAEVEAMLAGSDDPNVAAHLAHFLGFAAAVERDFEEMSLRLREALALYRELGDLRNVALCLPSLGFVTLVHHDYEEAARLFEEGLAMERDLKYRTVIFFHLMGLAAVATLRGHPRRTAKLYGASEMLRESDGFSLASVASSQYDYESYLEIVRSGLDDESFEKAWNAGRAMPLDEVIEYALGSEDTSAPEETSVFHPALTPREQEVALLIRRGLTNRQIAEHLTITERTVETHVSRILRKASLRSRTQIAAWVIDMLR
jgi:predicted ATPase/DNA-binding SARP family transcriptional activator/DNA-binding CsgD family transcriptional regulator